METQIAIAMSYAVRTVLTLWSHDAEQLHAPGATTVCRTLAASTGTASRASLLALHEDASMLCAAPETDLAGEARALLAWLAPIVEADHVLQEAAQSCATARR
jgi:hypothetical protein